MNDRRVFVDTNILVYTFDREAKGKREIAQSIVDPVSMNWSISWQVVQEFCSVGLHRFASPLTPDFLGDFLELVLLPHCRIYPSASLYQNALTIQQTTQYRFYDSLVVASAIAAGAEVLYSEDLQHGRKIGDLEMVNPFLT
ncbi:MAG: PIN domain-containing protein [Verrucomicrobiota bacterium]